MLCTGGEEPRNGIRRDVVVIAVEGSTGDALRCGESVQLVQIAVADQMRPESTMRRPDRVVDENAHVRDTNIDDAPRGSLCDSDADPLKLSFGARPLSAFPLQERSCVCIRRGGVVRKRKSSREIPGAIRSPTKQV